MLEFPVSEVQLSDYKCLKSSKKVSQKIIYQNTYLTEYVYQITYFGVRLNSLSRQAMSDIGWFILLQSILMHILVF